MVTPHLTRIISAVVLCVAAIPLQSPASAEETSAPYQVFFTKDCGSVSSCFIDFQTPNKGNVVVTSISCLVTVLDQASRLLYASATVYGKGNKALGRDALIPAYTNTANIGAFHSINTETTLYIRSGSNVELQLSMNKIATTIAECKVAGHFVK